MVVCRLGVYRKLGAHGRAIGQRPNIRLRELGGPKSGSRRKWMGRSRRIRSNCFIGNPLCGRGASQGGAYWYELQTTGMRTSFAAYLGST